jgi:hypothetical protein
METAMVIPARMLCLALGVLILLGACATPRFETVYRLEPPADVAGRACLVQCEDRLKTCQADCGRGYQACLADIEPMLDDAYAEALRQYAFDLESYAASLHHYEMQLWMGWHHDPWWFSPGWSIPYYYPWRPPAPPSRQQVRERLIVAQCDRDCGCQPVYEACFLACGGRKIGEERCIANCPNP